MDNILVSIIVPVYNVENYLHESLQSCIGQTYGNLEVICVNDGSTDSSLDILESYAKVDSRIKVFNKRNEGVVIARNIGLKHASGDFIYFLDADDKLQENALEELVRAQIQHSADIVRGSYKSISDDGVEIEKFLLPFNGTSEQWFDYLCSTGAGAMWNHLIRKSLYCKVVSVPSNLSVGEDLYALLQLSMAECKMVSIPYFTYFYRIRETSVMNIHGHEKSQVLPFVGKNIILCQFLLLLCEKVQKQFSDRIRLLACDKMTVNIFPYLKMVKDKRPVLDIYLNSFFKSVFVQKQIFRRSWKCYVSVLGKMFTLL